MRALALLSAMVLASNQWLTSAPGDIVMDNYDGGLTHFVSVSNGTPWPYLYARPPEPPIAAKSIGSGTIDAHVGGVIVYCKAENTWELAAYDSRADAGIRAVLVPYPPDGGCRVEYADGGSRVDHSLLCEEIKLVARPVADTYREFFGGKP